MTTSRRELLAMVGLPKAAAFQRAVSRAMEGRPGTALVGNVATGRLLAVHQPGMAARMLTRPGSTLKPFVALALLRRGRLRGTERLPCRREVRVQGRVLDCTHSPMAQPFDVAEALAYSCNSFFATVALRLRSGELAETCREFGFASLTGLLPHEATGQLDGPGNAVLAGLGEAGLMATPVGVLRAYRELARLASDASLEGLWRGLEGAVTSGTGQLARVPGLAVAGKTGTTTVLGGPGRHAWFAGFAPAREPRVVFVVLVPGGTGGLDAAPVVGEFLRAYRENGG